MTVQTPNFQVRLARGEDDLRLAQELRYDVFVEELGADGPLVDHERRREADRFDPFLDHLLLIDDRRAARGLNPVAGVYRLLPRDRADEIGQFYSEDEYDLTPLRQSGRRLLELGRSCLRREYRGGIAMHHLWSGLADYAEAHEIEVMFGVASFHGTDITALAQALSHLHHRHLAPPHLRVRSRKFQPMDLVPPDRIDRLAAMRATPALIKAYLRLGGHVGEGAFLDWQFNTTDICLVIETSGISARQRSIYSRTRV